MNLIGREQLVKLQKRYGSDAAIARFYGVGRQRIYKLRKKYDIPAVEGRNVRRNREICALHKDGVTAERIALQFKLSTSQIFNIIRKEGGSVDRRKRLFTNARELRDHFSGDKIALIAHRFSSFGSLELALLQGAERVGVPIWIVPADARFMHSLLLQMPAIKALYLTNAPDEWAYLRLLQPEVLFCAEGLALPPSNSVGKIEICVAPTGGDN